MRKSSTLVLALQVGCASITASGSDKLIVNASPVGATVEVNGAPRGPAPMIVEVPRTGRSVVEVVAPGLGRSVCDTSMTVGGGYIAADIALCVLLFPLGCVAFVDAAGAWNELRTPVCSAVLVPTP